METHVSFTPQSPRSCVQAATHTGNKLALTLVKQPLLHPKWHDVSADGPVSIQLRETYHLSSLSAGQPSPPHSASGRIIKIDPPPKGFYCKKGSLSSASPGIQSHISNRGQIMWHIVYLDCKPLEEGLCATINPWPDATGPCTRSSGHLPYLGLCESQKGNQKAEPQGLPGLCISKHALQLVWAQQQIKLQIICFTQTPSWKLKTKIENVAPQFLKKFPATLRPHLLRSAPILRQHQVTHSSISSATRFGTQDKGSLKVRSRQSLTVENQCNGCIYFSPLL